MRKRSLALAVGLLCCGALHGADAEDLIQIYRDALANDPIYASARANWAATQEVLPQARAGLLPLVSLLGIANQQDFHENLHSDPTTPFVQRFPTYSYTVSASQPLYRVQNWISYDQAKQQVSQADYVLASAQQDLILRVAQAYFDVLLAQSNFDIAALEVGRQRAGHYPTLDLVASFQQGYAGAAASTNIAANFASDTRIGLIGVQLNVPIYQGGLVNSRVTQAVANQDVARQNLEGARRTA